MLERLGDRKMNNRGSALLTVILVVGFLTILATTLLYITGMNFQIKQMDYANKKNFYSGETALEKIRAKLMKDASDAGAQAYNDVMMQYVTLDNKDMRELEYNTAFVKRVQELWTAKGLSWQELLESYYSNDAAYTLTVPAAGILEPHETDGFVRIKGLKITYVDPDTHLATILSTDLDVHAPAIDWSAEGTQLALESGVTADQAAVKTEVDAAECVRYANWKKE